MSGVARYLFIIGCLSFCRLVTAEETAPKTSMTVAPTSDAQETSTKTIKKPIGKIVVVSNAIFDESDPDAFFIHRWANYLHINSRESTILNKLSFSETDLVSQKDLEEAQRILRYEPYIRDAKVSFAQTDPDAEPSEEEIILVETWDCLLYTSPSPRD